MNPAIRLPPLAALIVNLGGSRRGMDEAHKRRLAFARFEALRNSPPKTWHEVDVDELNRTVTALEEAYAVDLSSCRIPRERMQRRPTSIQRAPRSGRYAAQVQLSTELSCDAEFARRQIGRLRLRANTNQRRLRQSHGAIDGNWQNAQLGTAPFRTLVRIT